MVRRKLSTALPRERRQADRRRSYRGPDRRNLLLKDSIHQRMMFIFYIVLVVFLSVGGRLAWVGAVAPERIETRQDYAIVAPPLRRGNIYDRYGQVVATTLSVRSLYADPAMVMDIEEVVARLTEALPDMDAAWLEDRLSHGGRFVWLRRQLTPSQVKAINDLGLPGLGFRNEDARMYPQRELLAHVVGAVNVDGNGLAGVEAAYNDSLAAGEDVVLSIDTRLQQQMRQTLVETLERTEGKAAWGVAINPNNGEVLAMASLPDYDPNHYGAAPRHTWLNRVTAGAYEMGSTFKIFTMAQALEQQVAGLDTLFDCTEPIRIGKFTIRDYHAENRWMSMAEVFMKSSNIGAARVADIFPQGSQKAFFRNLGLLGQLSPGVAEVASPLYPHRKWGRVHAMSMSYGHGIAVTPLHMVSAVGALVTDGHYRQPTLITGQVQDAPQPVVSPQTVHHMRQLLRTVVQEGTGRRAQVAGYDIGGKTGTAEKNEGGRYVNNRNLASFVGAVPLENPQMVVLMMVDEGKWGANTGGTAAAPAFGDFARRALPILGVAPQPEPVEPILVDHKQKEPTHVAVRTDRPNAAR